MERKNYGENENSMPLNAHEREKQKIACIVSTMTMFVDFFFIQGLRIAAAVVVVADNLVPVKDLVPLMISQRWKNGTLLAEKNRAGNAEKRIQRSIQNEEKTPCETYVFCEDMDYVRKKRLNEKKNAP